jgi:hypothetical protein
MNRSLLLFACVTSSFLLFSSSALAQDNGGRAGRAVATGSPPTIDGSPDEGLWMSAPMLGDFVQREPQDGAPATERTEVRVLYDRAALYVAVWLYDSRPEGIVPGEGIRDYDLEQSDAVMLILDTFRDEQNAFIFGTNPAGIEYDGQVANEGSGGGRFFGAGGTNNRRQQSGSGGGFNLNWDASWSVATSADGDGWYAEFRIPFSTLRYAAGENQTWGLNVARRVRRLNEQSFWSPIPRQFDQYRLNYAGALEGVNPPAQRVAQVTPYVLQKAQRDYLAGDQDFGYPGEVGGDAKVQVTSGLTLDMTYNTDFAQVEVDDAQTNLTRFSISFPEKRPFFLENAGFFNVGGGGAELFFSRRIGIREGQSVPIVGGGRVSGKAAGLNVGLLHIRTDEVTDVTAAQDYSVVRLAKELPNRSRIGGAFMRRASDVTDDWNNTLAIDGQVGLGESVTLSSFFARTETPGLDGKDHIFDVQGSYTTRLFRGNVTVREVGEDFNPELGFLPRNDHRYVQAFGLFNIRPEKWGVREIRPHVSYFTYRGLENDFEQTSRVHIDSHVEWESGMELHPAVNWVREGLEEPFEIAEGVVVPAGTYEGWESAAVFFTDESAPVSFNGGMNTGTFLTGSRWNPFGTVTVRSGSSFSTSVRVDYNDVSLPEGDFSVTLAGLRLAYFFTPRIYLQSLTQYSDQADSWSSNIRFGWLNTAGTGLFIVYNQANGFDSLSMDTPLNRGLTVKFTKLFNVADW